MKREALWFLRDRAGSKVPREQVRKDEVKDRAEDGLRYGKR